MSECQPSLLDQQFMGADCDAPWKRSEVDRMLDLFFSGIRLGRLAYKMRRTKESVRTYIKELAYNKNGKAEQYQPRCRVSRKGKHFSKNEVKFWQIFRENKTPIAALARLLQRDESEFAVSEKRIKNPTTDLLRQLLPTMDIIWAYRYIHFRYKKHIITDEQYDTLVAEEIEYGGGSTAFERVKAHNGWPVYIRSLALYLCEKSEQPSDNDNAKRSRNRPGADERRTEREVSQTQTTSSISKAGDGSTRRKRLI